MLKKPHYVTKHSKILAAALCTSMLSFAPVAKAEDMPSKEEMWKIIQQQQKQIDTLMKQTQKTEKKVVETAEKVEEASRTSVASGQSNGWWERTSVGGYGEMHYNISSENDDEIDFHRYVLFINHDFNDRIRLHSELELEHSLAGEGKNGEVELEQAYVEFDLTEDARHQARAGLFLLPVGILNETHEPPTFFGVERNPIESQILPTTWWEGGVAYTARFGQGFQTDLALHSGLQVSTTGSKAFNIRSGRQKVSEAAAESGAVTGRLKWTGKPGIELATSLQYQQDVTQDQAGEDADAILFETHADIRKGPWGLRALYARWDIDGATAKALGNDEQYGWYIEPSYRFDTEIGEVGVFARYNHYDIFAGGSADTDVSQTDLGVNYWPHPDVVLKTDIAFIDNPNGTADDEVVNMGVGFQF